MLAYRCRNHRSNAHHSWSVLQESPAQLRIFEFATTTIDERSVSHRLSNCVKMPCARTLSRTVWQQKNFCGYSAEASPTRAETNFSDESRSPIRMRAYRRERSGFGSRQPIDTSTRASIATSRTLRASHYGTLSDAELRLQQIVDGLRIGLAAGLLHHLADEPAGELRLGFRLRDLVRIGGDDVVDDLLDRAQVRNLLHAAAFDQLAWVTALRPDDLEQILCDLARYRALTDQVDDRRQLRRRHRRCRNIVAFFVETPEQLVDHPIGRELAVARLVAKAREHGFVKHRALALGHQHAGIIGRQAEALDEARLLLIRQFRQLRPEFVDVVLRELERQQIRIRKIAIVMRFFLGAHRARLAPVGIEQPRFLVDRAAILDDLDLAPRLVLHPLADEGDRFHVLDFAAGAERPAGLAHGNVHVGAQRALLHVAVAS